MDKIHVWSYDETFIQISSKDKGALSHISDYFSFKIPNARFHPKVKAKMWDGRIRLYNRYNGTLYKGLLHHLINFFNDFEYDYEIEKTLEHVKNDFDYDDFIKDKNLIYNPYDFQKNSFIHGVEEKRATFISPTASGKSFILYLLTRYLLENNKKILILVPSVSLVTQLRQEFIDYDPSFDINVHIHEIYTGKEKDTNRKIVISTWQSIYKKRKKYFEQYDCVMTDECHLASADSIKSIYEKSRNVEYRYGFTGTLQDAKCHQFVIEGLIGKIKDVTTTNTLMKKNIVSQLKINFLLLEYSEDLKKKYKKAKYKEEVDFVCEYKKRNVFISKLTNSIDKNKNILILTAYKEHMRDLYEIMKRSKKDVFIVHGGIGADEREKIRKYAENNSNVVIIATYGVYSTGINIKNIQYVLFATSSKSQVRVLQSIGRGLRKDGKNNIMILLDIVDDLSYKKKKNHLMRHFLQRVKIYSKQKFKYTIKKIKL